MYSQDFIHWKWILIDVKAWKAPLGIELSLNQDRSCVIKVKVILKGNLLLLVNASTVPRDSLNFTSESIETQSVISIYTGVRSEVVLSLV